MSGSLKEVAASADRVLDRMERELAQSAAREKLLHGFVLSAALAVEGTFAYCLGMHDGRKGQSYWEVLWLLLGIAGAFAFDVWAYRRAMRKAGAK